MKTDIKHTGTSSILSQEKATVTSKTDEGSSSEEEPVARCACFLGTVLPSSVRPDAMPLEPAEQLARREKGGKPHLNWDFLSSGEIFGREEEIEAIRTTFFRRITSKTGNGTNEQFHGPEFVLVSGNAGVGKTSLVMTALGELMKDHRGDLICGKFDQLQLPREPYGPFTDALTDLALSLSELSSCDLLLLQQRLISCIGVEGCHSLTNLVPALNVVLGIEEGNVASLKIHDAQKDRFKVAFQRFFEVVCAERPVCLVVDDLQWADFGSLDLLESIASRSIRGLFIVGICRSNEVTWHHDFAGMLRRLEDNNGVCITHIEVDCFSVGTTVTLLSEILRTPPNMCQALAAVIHRRSEGNCFVMIVLISALYT